MNGIIVVKKEKGFTSHDVIAKLRGVLHQKKMGHTGTLDPEAEGVLPVCIGFSTKVCDYLMVQKKEYLATGKLGMETDTQDIYGTVLRTCESHITKEQFTDALQSFVGTIEQLTPMYSARKIDGVKLIDLARQGKIVERSTKTVTVYEAELIRFDEANQEYEIRIVCQKGTYIRTICNDIGQLLGCGSCMTSLIRTATGRFTIAESHTIEEIRAYAESGRIDDILIPIDAMYFGCRPMTLDGAYRSYLANGNYLESDWMTPCDEPLTRHTESYENLLGTDEQKCVRIYLDGEFWAIYKKKRSHWIPLQIYHEVDNDKIYQEKMRLQKEQP